MKPYHYLRLIILSSLTPILTMPFTVEAQTAAKDDEIIELDAWTVTGQKVNDYRNAQAVSATRIAAAVVDTPLTLNVVGDEFLKDTGTTEFINAFSYESGIRTDPDSELNPSSGLQIRGFSIGRFLRNGYIKYYFQNLDGVDRLEVVRGPVAAFYGQAEPGGVINYITKKPLFDWSQSVKVNYGSWNYRKVLADSTGPLYKKQVAYRVISSYMKKDSWKDYVSQERTYFLGALTYRPTKKLEIYVDYEYNLNNQNGALRTALVQNENYTADYANWQDFAAKNNWRQWMYSNNDGKTRFGQPDYNFYNFTPLSRYPIQYNATDFKTAKEANDFYKNFPWLSPTGYVDPKTKETIFFVDPQTGLSSYKDPRTGLPQQPLFQRDASMGVRFAGGMQDLTGSKANDIDDSRLYRHGWRQIKMLESLGLWKDGVFLNATPNLTNYNYQPALTGQVYPNGYEFNPNGPGAWYHDESHIASGDIKFTPNEWLNLRYGANYYENWTKQVQQYNSDTDMDGYTLDAGQGFPVNPDIGTSGATGFGFFNRRWVHQADASINFNIGETKHTILGTMEYRRDYFMFYKPTGTALWETAGTGKFEPFDQGRGIPGFSVWDIKYDRPPHTNEWATEFTVFDGNSNATQQEGYGASYRGAFFKERLNLWTGVRHESQKQWKLNESGEQIGNATIASGTTPMFGANYQVIKKKLVVYVSYSESYIARGATTNNASYRDPFQPLRADVAAWLADPYSGAVPKPVGVIDTDFAEVPGTTLSNPKGIGYEMGLKADEIEFYDMTFSGSASVFHLERSGDIYNQSDIVGTVNDRYEFLQNELDENLFKNKPLNGVYVNAGKQIAEGVEFEGVITPIKNLLVKITSTYMFTKKVDSRDPLQMFGNKDFVPGVDSGPRPHPSLYFYDANTQAWLPKWNNNNNGVQEVGEKEGEVTEQQYLETGRGEVYQAKYSDEMANVPTFEFKIWTKYSFDSGRLKGLQIGGGYRYESTSILEQGYDRPWKNPELHLFDGLIGYEFKLGKGSMNVSLNVNNILDRKIGRSSFGILDPRSFLLTAEYKF